MSGGYVATGTAHGTRGPVADAAAPVCAVPRLVAPTENGIAMLTTRPDTRVGADPERVALVATLTSTRATRPGSAHCEWARPEPAGVRHHSQRGRCSS